MISDDYTGGAAAIRWMPAKCQHVGRHASAWRQTCVADDVSHVTDMRWPCGVDVTVWRGSRRQTLVWRWGGRTIHGKFPHFSPRVIPTHYSHTSCVEFHSFPHISHTFCGIPTLFGGDFMEFGFWGSTSTQFWGIPTLFGASIYGILFLEIYLPHFLCGFPHLCVEIARLRKGWNSTLSHTCG